MFTSGHPHNYRPGHLGPFTRNEENAIHQARDSFPRESQRSLARRLYRIDPELNHQGRVLSARSLQSIYGVIRRIDRERQGARELREHGPTREPAVEATA